MLKDEAIYRKGSDEVWDTIASRLSDDMSCGVFTESFFLDEIYPIRKTDLQNSIVLDAGCGGGRCILHASKYAKKIVGMDLANGVLRVAKENDKSSTYIQGDLSNPPIHDGVFDIIYSFGVLQHTPSPKRSFMNLTKALKPGGKILVWVYSKEGNGMMRYFIEPLKKWVLNHLSKKFLWKLSYPVTAIKWVFIHTLYLPADRNRVLVSLRKILPKYDLMVFWGKSRTFRWMLASVFDLLAAPIANYHSQQELSGWAEEARLRDIEISDRNGSVWKIYGRR